LEFSLGQSVWLNTPPQKVAANPADTDEANVVEQFKADPSLSARVRQIALQVALRISIDRINAAAPQPRPSLAAGQNDRSQIQLKIWP